LIQHLFMIRLGLSEVLKDLAFGIESLALKILQTGERVVPVHRHRVSVPLQKRLPQVERDTFVAPNASLIGGVKLGQESIVGWGSVIRGDHVDVQIGQRTTIGDLVTITPIPDLQLKVHPISIGDDVSIGSGSVLSGCSIGNGCVIDVGSKLSANVKMEAFSMLGPGSVVEPNQTIPSGQYWAGNPAKFVHDLSEEQKDSLPMASQYYRSLAYELLKTIEWTDETSSFPDKLRPEELFASPTEELEKIEKLTH